MEGKTFTSFVGLSIGTGLGMGVILQNKLHNGLLCGAGEIGMVTYKDSIIEHYASSLFFEKKFNISAKEMSILATQGDATAQQAYHEFGVHLGNAINNINYMIAPEAIVELPISIAPKPDVILPSFKDIVNTLLPPPTKAISLGVPNHCIPHLSPEVGLLG